MTKIDIISGFLGAGKTTLIKKLISEAYTGEKIVLIENEFGDVGIDGDFLKDSGIEINELNSGCICCSLVGDFSKALKKVIDEFSPDRVVIEPSGVGKLSDVIKAVNNAELADVQINAMATVADANKCKMYMKNFGEFFNDQIENAGCIIFSHTKNISDDKIQNAIYLIKEHNSSAVIVTADWDELDAKDILLAMEQVNSIVDELDKMKNEAECPVCGGHHHEHEHGECCHHEHGEHHHDGCCHHEHDEHHHDGCCHHEHSEHHHEGCCHHEHGEHHHGSCCHHEEHEHHHHHHADDIFNSCGFETAKKYSQDDMKNILKELEDEKEYGVILRAKGIVNSDDKQWIHFDYIPGEADVRIGSSAVCGRICVIGSHINEEKLKELFGV